MAEQVSRNAGFQRGGVLMRQVQVVRSESNSQPGPVSRAAGLGWPIWAQGAMSLALLYHIVAILAGALAPYPSSEIQRRSIILFHKYYQILNQGYGYRYYSRLDTTVDPGDPRPWG